MKCTQAFFARLPDLSEILMDHTMNKTISRIKTTILGHVSLRYFANVYVELTGKSLSEALLFAEDGENMLCTKNVLNVRNNFCTQHVVPRFELGIFMY